MSEAEGTDVLQLGRLRYRAWRRGFREADLLLGGYADRHAVTMSSGERADFERLLQELDVEIWAWVQGMSPPPNHIDAGLVARLRDFRLFPSQPLDRP